LTEPTNVILHKQSFVHQIHLVTEIYETFFFQNMHTVITLATPVTVPLFKRF